MNIIEMVLAKTGLAYSGVASSQSEPEVCTAEAESPEAGQKYWTWILVAQVCVSTFVCCLKRWYKTHQAVFASEENVHGTDDPISKDQSQPETNEGDILKWIRRNYQIRSFGFYTLVINLEGGWNLLSISNCWNCERDEQETPEELSWWEWRGCRRQEGASHLLLHILPIFFICLLSGPVLHPQNDKVLITVRRYVRLG